MTPNKNLCEKRLSSEFFEHFVSICITSGGWPESSVDTVSAIGPFSISMSFMSNSMKLNRILLSKKNHFVIHKLKNETLERKSSLIVDLP